MTQAPPPTAKSKRSSGLRGVVPKVAVATWRYRAVVLRLRWPSRIWMVRRSVPSSNRWSSKAVPKRVHGDVPLSSPAAERAASRGFIHGLGGQRPTGNISREEPWSWPGSHLWRRRGSPILPEQDQQTGREHDVAILGSLGLTDADDHALAVDVVGAQAQDLGDPEASVRRYCGHEDRPVPYAGDGL